jgi:hypothetical protein
MNTNSEDLLILTTSYEQQEAVYLQNTYIDNLAHKILHTFEKMDTINPTFELILKHIY